MSDQISLAAGVIIEKGDQILLVYEKGHWGLPKGKRDPGESLAETAIREAKEETGLTVQLEGVAFVTEFQAKDLGYFMQVFYQAKISEGTINIMDPDKEVEKVAYIDKEQIRKKMTFRPRLLPLEYWLKHRQLSYHYFNLDDEPYFINESLDL